MLFPFFTKTGVLFSFLVFFTRSTAGASPLDTFVTGVWNSSSIVKEKERQVRLSSFDRYRRFIFDSPSAFVANNDDGSWTQFGLSLNMGFPGKALMLSQNDSVLYRESQAELRASKHDVARQAVEIYGGCISKKQRVELKEAFLRDTEALNRSFATLYESGHTTQSETVLLRLQVSQLESDLQSEKNDLKAECEKLQNIYGFSPAPANASAMSLSTETLQEIGVGTAEVQRQRTRFAKADVFKKTASLDALPDVAVSWSQNHYKILEASPLPSQNRYWTDSFMVQLKVPIFGLFHELPTIKRAKSEFEVEKKSAEISLAIAEAEQRKAKEEHARISFRLKQLRERDYSLASTLAQSAFQSYRNGKISFAELAMARKVLTDIQMEKIDLERQYVLAQLECLDLCYGGGRK